MFVRTHTVRRHITTPLAASYTELYVGYCSPISTIAAMMGPLRYRSILAAILAAMLAAMFKSDLTSLLGFGAIGSFVYASIQ